MPAHSFTFEYDPPTIHHGAGVVDSIESELHGHDLSRALVVTGSTVGSTAAVMDPVREGVGDSLVGVFDDVSSGKYLRTAYEGATRVRESNADAVVGVGGGASLDVAKLVAALAAHERPLDAVVEEILESGTMLVPDGELPAVVAVPTTLPGADISQIAGVKLSVDPETTPRSQIPNGGVSDPRLLPAAVFHDVDLLATTPEGVLANSAMNGYNKGIEMLYARHRTPVTDATAMRGLRLLQSSLPAVRDEETSNADYSRMLQGVALTQYGISTPDAYRASVIHAFGHALSRNLDVQQGVAHGIATPHVLRYIFENVDGRRRLLAEALDVLDAGSTADETAEAVVSAVTGLRDALELPDRLRVVDGARREQFADLARAVLDDPFMAAAPPGLEPDQSAVEAVFDAMW